MARQDVQLAHELDDAWIMALYKAVHGGDPAPEVVATQVIAAVAPYLKGAAHTMTFPQLETQFKTLGADVIEKNMEVQPKTESFQPDRQYSHTHRALAPSRSGVMQPSRIARGCREASFDR
jgi:hypothetical protein